MAKSKGKKKSKEKTKRDKDAGMPGALLTLADYERAAQDRLTTPARDYYRSGADGEQTLGENLAAFRRFRIWPRILRDVSERDLRTVLLGRTHSWPALIAPTAYHKLAHADGELATARAADRASTTYVVSTMATTRLEDVASASHGPKWFQLYVHRDRDFAAELVHRAATSGYEALVLTADTPTLGRRLADERNRFSLPEGMTMANIASAPAFEGVDASALARYVATRHDPALTFADIEWLCGLSKMPVVVKGVLRPDDARRAVDAGARGIIVSNHGARQLDGVPATLDALGGVAKAVGGRADVMLDGGVRWGTDVLKAVALGAKAVLVGRPVLWGLAVNGEDGVFEVLRILREELDRAMTLSGAASLADLDPDLVLREGLAPR